MVKLKKISYISEFFCFYIRKYISYLMFNPTFKLNSISKKGLNINEYTIVEISEFKDDENIGLSLQKE